jgi:phosphatidyl-myo-inositol dimannoside synthase
MRVLALVTDAFGGFGGIAQYNRDFLTALARCGGDVLVLPRQGGPPASALPSGVRQLAPKASKIGYALASLRAALAGGPFDAVFCGHLHMAPLAAIVARLAGAPLWLQLHGVEAWQALPRAQGWAARRARLVTAVSRHTRRQFLRFAGIDPTRVRVLPNTFDQALSPGPKPDYLLDRYGLRGKRVLLTVGRLAADERRKGHDRVIEALAAMRADCPDLVYVVAGRGDDRPRLEGLARRRGIEDRVMFVGPVAPAELADHYRLADVFVMPSSQEGFGIVFLEAAACGRKPIGGNRDGSRDALADGAIGIAIDPSSSEELVRAIADAMAGRAPDPGEVRRFGFDNFALHVCGLAGAFAQR